MLLPLAAVLSTMHLEGDVTADGGDYVDVAFTVPAGTAEIRVAHTDGSDNVILDWGVWSPDGFRGWGGGLVDDAVIGVDQSSRGYLPGPITPGSWTVVVGKAELIDGMGHYSIDVTCSDSESLPLEPQAAFAPVVLSPQRRWYKGDFHVHSRESGDAAATFDEIYALATMRGLDFVNLSDHNTVSQHALQAAYMQTHPGLLLLRGAEITTYGGHGNAVGIADYVDHRIGYAGRTIDGVLDDVGAQNGLFIVNHPKLDLGTSCIGCAWTHDDDTDWSKVSGLELITGNYELGTSLFVPEVIPMWDSLLDQGFRIAAMGGSDDHTAGMNDSSTGSPVGSPTTLVLADNLSEAAIMDAIRHGRTLVQMRGPDDPLVDVTMQTASGGTAEIGDDVSGVDHVAMTVHVTGGDGDLVAIVRDGMRVGPLFPVSGADATDAVTDVPGKGDHRYRVELLDPGGHRIVVTSHIYVHAVDPAMPAPPPAMAAGCGCGATGGAGGALPMLAMLWGLRRRRGRRPAAGQRG